MNNYLYWLLMSVVKAKSVFGCAQYSSYKCSLSSGGEGLAQDRDQCLQGRKWEHIQLGVGGGLYVWRPSCP